MAKLPQTDPPNDHADEQGGTARQLAWRTGILAASTAAILALAKLVVGVVGHSSAVTASAVDSLIDVVASTTNALAIHFAGAEADREHPFGHGKIEALATSLQGLLIVGSALYLFYRGASRLILPEPLASMGLTLGVMTAVTLVNGGLVFHMRRIARRTASPALLADSTHYAADIAQNTAVLVGVAVVQATGWFGIDGALTLLVSLYIGHSGWRVLRPAIDELIDTRADDERLASLEGELAELCRQRVVDDYHGLRTRVSGRTLFVEIHIELPGQMRLSQAHRVGDEVRDRLVAVVPEAEVLVHIDVERDEPPLASSEGQVAGR